MKYILVIIVATVVLGVWGPGLSRFGLGRLPGDITFNYNGRRIYAPITTTIIVSLALSFLLRLI